MAKELDGLVDSRLKTCYFGDTHDGPDGLNHF